MPKTADAPLDEAALAFFRRWGQEGGRERAKRLSKETQRRIGRKAARARWLDVPADERSEIARKAAQARWAKKV